MTNASWPWPSGAATGIGSLPGTDVAEAVRMVLGELPDLPFLPELPDRGPGADLTGRGAALLVDLPVQLYASRWQVAARPGRDLRAARDFLERDLDTVTEQAAGFDGTFKTQAAGAFTLASTIELRTGGPMLRDPGAVRELAASLAEGLRAYVADLSARLPRATIMVQLDEPALPAVLAGRVPTESGFGTLRPVEPGTAQGLLTDVVAAVGAPVAVHCCAADVPLELIAGCGAAAAAIDLRLVRDLDTLGEVLDAGLGLIAGAVDTRPPLAPHPPSSAQVAEVVRETWRRIGFPDQRLPTQVVVAPACGLAGAPAGYARAAFASCRDAARRLRDEFLS